MVYAFLLGSLDLTVIARRFVKASANETILKMHHKTASV